MGSRGPTKATRSTRNPSLPMVEAVVAMKTSIPWITAMTAISVVVDRMIPSSVRKLRSLLDRSESSATEAASRKEARDCTIFRIRESGGESSIGVMTARTLSAPSIAR